VDSEPLHAPRLEGGEWWACQEPERPHEWGCSYDARCGKCVVMASAALANGLPDRRLSSTHDPSGPTMLLSEIAAGKGLDR
jgi:hypothetical protein